MPRCVKPEQYDYANTDLHIFSNTSEHAYGCCVYMRSVNRNARIHVLLLCRKNKLAPIKSGGITRLGLKGAQMAVVMDHNVLEELVDVMLVKSTFWTGSMKTRVYVKNKTTPFHVFVSNRISIILQYLDPSHWHHIPGADNPADILTRGIYVSQLNDTWIQCISFLWKYRSELFKEEYPQNHLHPSDPEVKRTYSLHTMVTPECHYYTSTQLIQNHSALRKLKIDRVWIIKLNNRLQGKQNEKVLTIHEVKQAELTLIRHIQMCQEGASFRSFHHNSMTLEY